MLNEPTDLSAIRSAWGRVFRSTDAFSWPFQPTAAAGRIFYPTDGGQLNKPQFLAVVEASKQIGESGFFLSIVESEGLSFLDRSWGHWESDEATYDEYSQLHLTLENAIYSREGHWGVLISHEMHALIAGSTEFMAAVAKNYPGWAVDLRLLREAWVENPNSDWLEPTIKRTAGD